MTLVALSWCGAGALTAPIARGDDGLNSAASQPTSDPARLEWFRDAKFGMFIHWGVYAVPAGRWGDRTDLGEWFQLEVGLPNSEYEKYAAEFNPVKFDAAQWADVARRAGMKYMVVTTKHHDGFCMFNSQHTDYDIVDATPFKRDPMKELADAVRDAGLKMGFYYSLTDWHHPEVPAKLMQTSHGSRSLKKFPDGFHGDPNLNADIKKYNRYMRDKLAELLSNYGPISVLWFDAGSAFKNVDRPEVLEADAIVSLIRKLQPDCLINNRLGAGRDYGTPEQKIPDTKLPEPFEVCMTLNGHWGFNAADQKWKLPAERRPDRHR
jgi:alpha-L-fucosidase